MTTDDHKPVIADGEDVGIGENEGKMDVDGDADGSNVSDGKLDGKTDGDSDGSDSGAVDGSCEGGTDHCGVIGLQTGLAFLMANPY